MVNILRKYQQPLLIGITILVIASFVWYWNGPAGHAGAGLGGSNTAATIYGQGVTETDIKQDVNKWRIAQALGLNSLLQGLSGNAQNQQEALENFVWDSYVFNHEADALQVFPTDAEVRDEEARVPFFQTDGQFDANKLNEFVQNVLPSMGFNDSIIDDLVRQQVRVRKVTNLIGATVDISPAELRNRFIAENEKMDIAVIRLNSSDLEKSITVTDDEAKKAYDEHKDTYRSDEQRKVSIASFELTDAQKALTGRTRTEALQKLGEDAWNFAQAVVDKSADFAAQAKKASAPLSQSAFFTETQPDSALAKIPSLATTAFRLTKDLPSSDVVEGQNGDYVLHLEDSVPSRQLSFDEAKPKVVAQIQKDRATQMMQTRANQIRNQILAALKAGKTITEAATLAGVSAEPMAPFSLSDASKLDVPDLEQIIQNSISLGDHQLSEFTTTAAGGLFIYVNGRQAPDKNAVAIGEETMKDQFTHEKQMGAFLEWLRLRKADARLQIVQR